DVRLETDAATGKTFVRVDGRIATRPIMIEEEEREFPVGGVTYLLRRQPSGDFDLDIAPPSATNPSWGGPKTETAERMERRAVEAPKREKRAKIISFVVAIICVFISKYLWNEFSSARIKWQPYPGEAARFRISFPGPPKEEQQPVADGRATGTVLT